MKTLLAMIIGLVLTAFSTPATAFVVGITTWIPVASAEDDEQLKVAIQSAVDDVLEHAIAFVPTVVTLQGARVVGDRIYILLLVADGDGEQAMKLLSIDAPPTTERRVP